MRQPLLRSVASLTTIAVISAVLLAGAPASAHPDEPGTDAASQQAAEEHARQDLAGLSMAEIEARSAGPDATPRAPAATPVGDRGRLGEWSPVIDTEVVPVFTAVLPNGKVLMWDSVGVQPTESYDDQSFTRARLVDPTAAPGAPEKNVDVQGYNIFCAGYVQLPDGDVLVVGGNKNRALDGIMQTHLFDWQSETWSRGPDMAGDRWYPSVAALGNGEALIVGGGPRTAEVYQTDGRLRPLIGFQTPSSREYPFLVPRGDGLVEAVGPAPSPERYDTAGTGSRTERTVNREYGDETEIYRAAGSFVTYDLDQTMVAGGGPNNGPGMIGSSPTAYRVDTSRAGRTSVSPLASMNTGRRQHNLTALADGSVLATGGAENPDHDLVDLDDAVRVAERWDPRTDTWTRLSSAARVRQYHSTATLLPDGRVMTGGGGICGECARVNYLEKNVEYFSPPYLFAADGSPAVRPTISNVPTTAGYAQDGLDLVFSAAGPRAVSKVALIRLGANTHSIDQGQRYLPLSFRQTPTRAGVRIDAVPPQDGNAAPPGHYMLVVVDAAGVPSVATILRVGPGLGQQPPPAELPLASADTTNATNSTGVLTGPPTGIAPVPAGAPARCVQARGGGLGKRPMSRAVCAESPKQVWRRSTDATLRLAADPDRCLTYGRGAIRPGTPVLVADCTGGPRQRTVVARGTIRPSAARELCVSSTGRGMRAGARLVLRPCTGNAAQRWDWRRARG